MDKNKSSFKLKNFGPILWLNLDSDTHRREYMEEQFKYWEIENHTRISGYDGRTEDLGFLLKGKYPDDMSQNEVGCCLSHIKAIKYFYEEMDSDYVIIMEDDIDFQTVRSWDFTWNNVMSLLPYNYDTVQFTTINPAVINITLHNRFVNDFSAACYIITRHHAEKIIKNHVRDDKYKLDNGVKPRSVSEDLIFESGRSYCVPLFVYRLDLGSSIHPEHIEIYHKNSHDAILGFWKQNGMNMKINELMGYDPYVARLPLINNPEAQQ